MARYYDAIGYNDGQTEQKPGVFVDVIVERKLYGDIVRNSRQLREGETLNDDLTVQNSISVVADEYANEHFHAIRYAWLYGTTWKVEDVTPDPDRPRLVLRLGGVYNGPRAAAPDEEGDAP